MQTRETHKTATSLLNEKYFYRYSSSRLAKKKALKYMYYTVPLDSTTKKVKTNRKKKQVTKRIYQDHQGRIENFSRGYMPLVNSSFNVLFRPQDFV